LKEILDQLEDGNNICSPALDSSMASQSTSGFSSYSIHADKSLDFALRISHNLNISNIHKVVGEIRDALDHEKNIMMEEIEMMNRTLEGEIDTQRRSCGVVYHDISGRRDQSKPINQSNKKAYRKFDIAEEEIPLSLPSGIVYSSKGIEKLRREREKDNINVKPGRSIKKIPEQQSDDLNDAELSSTRPNSSGSVRKKFQSAKDSQFFN
jgi:hypothetical protein